MKYVSVERSISADLALVWLFIADVGNYADFAPNIDSSEIVSGAKTGLVRECASQKDGRWLETCTVWQDLSHYGFRVHTEAADYPFPLKHLEGKWSVEKIDDGQTRICMTFEFEFKNKLVGFLAYPIMKKKFLTICEKLLDNWEQSILGAA